MADFNDGPPPKVNKKTVAAAPSLPEDLILEVIVRLPLKQATRCSLLNRNLCRCIAQPEFRRRHSAASSAAIFHCSAKNPKIFTRFCNGICPQSELPRETSIKASCNGILLLYNKFKRAYSVFNPVTGGIRAVDFPVDVVGRSVALAVGSDNADPLFKLVTADVAVTEPDRTVVIINVFHPSPNPNRSMYLKDRDVLVSCRRFTLEAADYNVRPVYAAGTVYFLGDDAQVTVAYDLIKEQGSVTDGPVNGVNRTGDMWFGYTAGSVRFVHSLKEAIVIYCHDRVSSEWRVDHRIPNISSPSNNDYKYGQCMHFDGRRLFFLVRLAEKEGHVYVYDVSRAKWETSDWRVRYWADRHQCFFSIVPTNARVCDINEEKTRRTTTTKNVIETLSQKVEREKLELELKENEAVLRELHTLMKPTAE